MERRSSGILQHVTSLPSRFGIGDLGPGARAFVDFLARARQRWWQVLPVGPPAAGNSPYLPQSAFAGNPLLVSPESLLEAGLLDAADLAAMESPASDRVDFGAALRVKEAMLDRAHERFFARGDTAGFDAFVAANAAWLAPFAAFRALSRRHNHDPWWEWPTRDRASGGAEIPAGLEADMRREMFAQFVFERQWQDLRAYARGRGVRLFGDVPFYVAGDSADAWNRPELFVLDDTGRAARVAGVPPDSFGAAGQLWGNPVYNWPAHADDGFAWWRARMRRNTEWFDRVRLDHFRGFAAHWEVPAGSAVAADGVWVPGPGRDLVGVLVGEAGAGRLVAEDLGVITPDVDALMRAHALPGMRVLQFAFEGDPADNPHAPHHHRADAVVYTGTHDNDTARGWFERRDNAAARARLERYLGHACDADTVAPVLVRMAMASVCDTAIIPMQDVLGLGSDARMNRPATPAGNWVWRMTPAQRDSAPAGHLAQLTETYGRT